MIKNLNAINVNPIQSNHRLISSHHLYVVRINFDKYQFQEQN